MFESDNWLDWEPDPERAAREADPALEPYASMTRRQILALMADAKGGREWEFLQEFFLNTCQAEELAVGIEAFIKAQYGDVFGFEELCYLEGAIEMAIQRRIARIKPSPVPGDGTYPFRGPVQLVPVIPVSAVEQSGSTPGR